MNGQGTTHDLLLALAGYVDDDLLAWGRELVAVGEDGHAVELLVASLIADRTVLPDPVRAAVVDARPGGRSELDAHGELPPPTPEDATAHRFDPAAGPVAATDRIREVLGSLPAPRVAGCRLWLTWRLTPAGAAPGPLPHAVVLVEVAPGPWAPAAEALAYQLAVTLARAGEPASVEVFPVGVPLSDYHVSALRTAVALTTAEAQPVRHASPRPGPAAPAVRTASPVPRSAPQPAPETDPPEADVEPVVADTEPVADTDRPRPAPSPPAPSPPAGAPLARPTSPRRIPTYRSSPASVAQPAADGDDADLRAPEPNVTEPNVTEPNVTEPHVTEPHVTEPPSPEPRPRPSAPSQDTLRGPVHEPLLDPLPDPTIDQDDPLGLGRRPLAGASGPQPRTWADDWESGDWTIPADRPGEPAATSAPEPAAAGHEHAPDQPARPASGGGPRHLSPADEGEPARTQPPAPPPEPQPPPPDPPPGPSPESLARLSSTERQLLAQLQAELAAREHHPQPHRRVRVTHSNGATPHPPDRPDPAA